MFSGIVETSASILAVHERPGILAIHISKPNDFNDICRGESICVDGVCLTVEEFTPDEIQFALATETLAMTGWTPQTLLGRKMNLERSLKLSDRIHGHL